MKPASLVVAAGLVVQSVLSASPLPQERPGKDVTVKQPLHPELDEEAVKAMKQWEFKPGTKGGKPVDVAVDVEMTFTLK